MNINVVQSADKKKLAALVDKHGLRPVLNALAAIVQDHIDEDNPMILHRGDEPDYIEVDDLHTAKANLEGDLF